MLPIVVSIYDPEFKINPGKVIDQGDNGKITEQIIEESKPNEQADEPIINPFEEINQENKQDNSQNEHRD